MWKIGAKEDKHVKGNKGCGGADGAFHQERVVVFVGQEVGRVAGKGVFLADQVSEGAKEGAGLSRSECHCCGVCVEWKRCGVEDVEEDRVIDWS